MSALEIFQPPYRIYQESDLKGVVMEKSLDRNSEGLSNPMYESPDLHIYSSIYDDVAVERAFGPSMKDVSCWFLQEQRSRYKTVQNFEIKKPSSRPPLPLPDCDLIGKRDSSYFATENYYNYSYVLFDNAGINLVELLQSMAKCGWYWGPLTRQEADEKLNGHDNGTFLVRDSCNARYLFSTSFRTQGKTVHTRIEFNRGYFSLWKPEVADQKKYKSVTEMIEKSMQFSQKNVLCHTLEKRYPVRFLKPLSRRTKVQSLQHYCRFVIRQSIRFDRIRQLPLPRHVHTFLEESSILT